MGFLINFLPAVRSEITPNAVLSLPEQSFQRSFNEFKSAQLAEVQGYGSDHQRILILLGFFNLTAASQT